MKNKILRTLASLLTVVFIAGVTFVSFSSSAAKATVTTIDMTDELEELMSQATSFILVRHKQLGNSHYAYTDSISDHSSMNYEEYSYYGGSKLCLVTLEDNEDGTVTVSETVLKNSQGIIRDPDVSEDGTRFVFSWKKDERDDFHIYEYDLTTDSIDQLTFGTGVADVEPVYTANGSIVFNSTRDIQTVDCWYTPVMNLYMMDGDPDDPAGDSWGGSFEPLAFSPHGTFSRDLTLQDTVRVYSVMDMVFYGPEIDVPEDSVVFTMTTDRQNWPGYYIGEGRYMVRYSPKQEAVLHYSTKSAIPALNGHEGDFVVDNTWPGMQGPEDFPLGDTWYTDLNDPASFQGRWQGAETVRKHRQEVLDLWDRRWGWLKQ